MRPYTGFAEIYDKLMEDIPYTLWGDFIKKIFDEEQVKDGIVLDLCCGSGNMTEILAAMGYDMIGVDSSPEMLQMALEKKNAHQHEILYLMQDMCELELYGTVRGAVCVCDSINYVLQRAELVEVFRRVNNYLDPGGLFIFDFNTDYKYRYELGQRVIAENAEEGSFIWENDYDEEKRVNHCQLTLFIREGENRDDYKKYEESHEQKGYYLTEIESALKEAGMKLEAVYDDYRRILPGEKTGRICVVAREQEKRGGD